MAANAPEDRLRVRNATPGPRGGGLYLSRVQLARLLDAAVALVAEEGVKRLSATRVSARAGMSSKTFYDLFADGEDCLLAVLDRAVDELAAALAPAWSGGDEWVERVRAALVVLLASLERDRALARVVFVDALGAGPRVLARRAEVLDRVAGFVDEGREGAEVAGELPPMTGAGVVGAAFSMIHTRLVEQAAQPERDTEPLVGLLNDLMATVVLPYRGREAAGRELSRPAPELPAPEPEAEAPRVLTLPEPLPEEFRLTVRRHAVLSAVAELCGEGLEPCNRDVCGRVGIPGDAQISRFMTDLEAHGLVENARTGLVGIRKAWRITARGRAVLDANGDGRASIEKEDRPLGRPARKGTPVNGRVKVRPGMPAPAPGPGRGGGELSVAERQRARLLEATFALAAEEGYRELTVGVLVASAGVSRRTFYEFFSDREDCFLAAFEHAVDLLAERVLPAYESEREWDDRVRAGLAALLEYLDGEPALRRLLFVEALTAGPRVLARRTQILDRVTAVIDGGRAVGKAPAGVPALVGQGIAGATFGVIYGQVSERDPEPLIGLLGSLMATIVLPYRGSAAAAAELERPAPEPVLRAVPRTSASSGRPLGSTLPADFRLTVRTQMALVAVAQGSARGSYLSNLQVAQRIGISAKAAVSRMMSRLQEQGLIENTRGRDRKGVAKAWRLTPRGQAVLDAHRPVRAASTDDPAGVRGGKLVPKRGRSRPVPVRPASAGLRLTVRTHLVLTAVAELGGRGSYPSGREIAEEAGVRDEGQISKLLARLQDRGLLHNTARGGHGNPKAWRLTPQGEALLHANTPAHETQAA
jgi:AcrR family transcriptional regulator/DNA-binding PadR family transcriptional regulator